MGPSSIAFNETNDYPNNKLNHCGVVTIVYVYEVPPIGKKKIRQSALDRQFFAGLKWAEAINTLKGDNFGRMWREACEPFYDHETGLYIL